MDEMNIGFVKTAWEIMDALHQAQNTADGLVTCLDILCREMSCEQGSIWVKGKSGENLYALAQYGNAQLAGTTIAMGEGMTGRTAATGKAAAPAPASSGTESGRRIPA